VGLVAGIAGIGMLEQERIMINLQDFLFLASVSEIAGDMNDPDDGSFICKCENPNFIPGFPLPPQNIHFDPMFCEFEEGDPFESANMLCTWETSLDEYGGFEELFGEGCGVRYWENKYTMMSKRMPSGAIEIIEQFDWPSGYSSNNLYNNMFQTNLALPVGTSDDDDVGTGRHDVATEDDTTRDATSRFSTDRNISNATLLDALNTRGGALELLARESVAAMLNAAHDEIDYKYDVNQVMELTQTAISTGDYYDTVKSFKTFNSARSASCP